jgi:hypothetical protein
MMDDPIHAAKHALDQVKANILNTSSLAVFNARLAEHGARSVQGNNLAVRALRVYLHAALDEHLDAVEVATTVYRLGIGVTDEVARN